MAGLGTDKGCRDPELLPLNLTFQFNSKSQARLHDLGGAVQLYPGHRCGDFRHAQIQPKDAIAHFAMIDGIPELPVKIAITSNHDAAFTDLQMLVNIERE